jgi:hypothetical protein
VAIRRPQPAGIFTAAAEKAAHLGPKVAPPPLEVVRAQALDAIARRYGVLPTEVLEADAAELFHIIELVNAAERGPEQES